MSQKQFLHELLKQDQEPFRLKNFIADRRYHLKKSTPPPANLPLRKRNKSSNILCKHACFLSFQKSPDVTKSPFFDFPSPVKSPCNGAVFIHIPSKTAALFVEASTRIQKQQQSHGAKNIGLGLLGSFMKRLSKTKKRAIGEQATTNEAEEIVRMSCSCSANWAENNELDFEASTSSCGSDEIIYGDFEFCEKRFCTSTPEFCSPTRAVVTQENENYRTSNSDNIQEEDKEHCSPVSVFDPPFEDELECSYENVESRAKYQLLYKLRRFEKLPKLDRMELERDSVEGHEQLSVYKNMSTDMKKLMSDLISEEQNEIVSSCDNEVVMSRICDKLDLWREVKPNTIDMMVGFDLKGEFDGWTRFNKQVEEISEEIEVAILGVLLEELSQELD